MTGNSLALESATDEVGRVIHFEIDPASGNRLSRKQIVGLDDTESDEDDDVLTTYAYTDHGLLETETDPLGRVTQFKYDDAGRLEELTFALGTDDEAFQRFRYDEAGNQILFIDENGNETEFEYDVMNRLVRIIEADPDGLNGPLLSLVTVFEYDEAGNLARTIDAIGTVSRNDYDPLNRLVVSRNALNNETRFEYDWNGNITATIDPLGNRTRNEYDGRHRLTATVDAEGGRTELTYDFDDNLKSLKDPAGNVTKFDYDARNRLVRETDALDSGTLYEYDAADNLVKKTDREERVSKLEYDTLDRLFAETWIESDGVTVSNEVFYEYDKASNLRVARDSFSRLEFAYDNRDRVLSVDNALTPNAPHGIVRYGYDDAGNVLRITDLVDGALGATTTYEYDALNRVKTILQEDASGRNVVSEKRVDFGFNANSQYAYIERYSDLAGVGPIVRSTYVYDDANRIKRGQHANREDVLAFYDYGYDSSGRIQSITDVDGATHYSYDKTYQLTGARRGETDTRGDEDYVYDLNGNRESSHLSDTNTTDFGNRFSENDDYLFEYDDEGNLVKRTEKSSGDCRILEYDHRNRLQSVREFGADGTLASSTAFKYDVFNRRILKTHAAEGAWEFGKCPLFTTEAMSLLTGWTTPENQVRNRFDTCMAQESMRCLLKSEISERSGFYRTILERCVTLSTQREQLEITLSLTRLET